MGNTVKTFFLLALLTVLVVLIGRLIGGQQGMIIAFVLAILMNFFSYWFSDKIVLAGYGAQQVTEAEAPQLYHMVQNLAQRDGLPMPKLYIMPSDTPNAFATGRNPEHAAVAVTEGIMRMLNQEELEGVIAHELSHVKNRDILISTIAATMAGAIMILASMARFAAIFGGLGGRDRDDDGGGIIGLIVMAIVAPLAAMLIQMAISRAREYKADESGARLTKKPWGLAKALEKIEYAAERIPMQEARPATAHLFIVNPLRGSAIWNLFSTHPPIEERIARLREMSI